LDNGQDEHNAGQDLGAGPQPSYYAYPLTNARRNFEEMRCCFVEDNQAGPALKRRKQALIDRYYDLIRCTTEAEAATIWEHLWSLLHRW
jgi:hypothetical protein